MRRRKPEERCDLQTTGSGPARFKALFYIVPRPMRRSSRSTRKQRPPLPACAGYSREPDWPDTLIGLYMGDKPPLARGRVRYHGEPVAAVVAETEAEALQALRKIKVTYESLPTLGSPEGRPGTGRADPAPRTGHVCAHPGHSAGTRHQRGQPHKNPQRRPPKRPPPPLPPRPRPTS